MVPGVGSVVSGGQLIEDLYAIERVARACWQTSESKGFHKDKREFGTRLMLIVSELAEALEEYRDGRKMDEIYYSGKGDPDHAPKPEGIPIEMADVFIRLGDLVVEHGIPLTKAMATKMEYNRGRPHMHGKTC